MIGKIIRQRRLELGMTQEELAHKLGYKSKSSINKIEIGVNGISQSQIAAFAKALDCSPYLFIETVQHDSFDNDAVMEYARKLASLPPAQLDNAMKYIDFLMKE
jgi:transcriptional regulator with XRE-family HTH domain